MSLSRHFRPGSFLGKILFLGLLILIVFSMYERHFETLETYLGRFSYKIGTYNISLYSLFSGSLLMVTCFWITAIVSEFTQNRILRLNRVGQSNRYLIAKFAQILLYAIAFLTAMRIIGIDLTAFSIFGGAIGIGLGFGLQKTASNFISGIILLYEKTIKIGDLVELEDGVLGFVQRISGRYTLIETFESKEIIVPNEDMMTNKVVNHTLSTTAGRVDINVGVSYTSDIKKAHSLILEAARSYPGTIQTPEPNCFLTDFGDSSVNFLLHFWVSDVKRGRFVPKSDVLFDIWQRFKDNGIEIPFPQRDLHLKTLPKSLSEDIRFQQTKSVQKNKDQETRL